MSRTFYIAAAGGATARRGGLTALTLLSCVLAAVEPAGADGSHLQTYLNQQSQATDRTVLPRSRWRHADRDPRA